MSRIGKKTIQIPQGVTVGVEDGFILVTGSKGKLERPLHSAVSVLVQDGIVTVDVKNKEDKSERALWGTFASHIVNMIEGVTKGFEKKLEINGVGYRVALQGKDLKLDLGFSHPIIFPIPEGLVAVVEKNVITITGADKELLGQTCAEIRSLRKPEPYKGKGIKYLEEIIRRKAGKAGKA